jgi:hypothetical protein
LEKYKTGGTLAEVKEIFHTDSTNSYKLLAKRHDSGAWFITYCKPTKRHAFISCTASEKPRLFRTEIALFKALLQISPLFKCEIV